MGTEMRGKSEAYCVNCWAYIGMRYRDSLCRECRQKLSSHSQPSIRDMIMDIKKDKENKGG